MTEDHDAHQHRVVLPHRVSTMCLVRMAIEFETMVKVAGRPRVLTSEMEDRALACLCICGGRRDVGSALDMGALFRCIQAMGATELESWKLLPFTLGMCLLRGTIDTPSGILRPHVTHGSAAIRGYVFVIGWIIREHLNPDELTRALLLNVENTLGYWVESLALCRSLYPTEEEFWRAVENYRPIDMADQFAERIEEIRKKKYLVNAPNPLLDNEARIQKLVIRCALGIGNE